MSINSVPIIHPLRLLTELLTLKPKFVIGNKVRITLYSIADLIRGAAEEHGSIRDVGDAISDVCSVANKLATSSIFVLTRFSEKGK